MSVDEVWAWTILALAVVYLVGSFILPMTFVLAYLVPWGGVGFLLAVGCLWSVGVLSGSV